ncbi:MAG: hypothetical protein H6699_06360 [Myxococcales bacterium]|nr:hypothetical protein [Myxococcales bacterium]
MDSKKNTTTTTLVETRTATRVRTATTLTREEELVIRMTRGLSEGAEHVLEYRGAGSEELAARLGLIEAALLADVYDIGPFAETAQVDQGVKDLVLSKLSKL